MKRDAQVSRGHRPDAREHRPVRRPVAVTRRPTVKCSAPPRRIAAVGDTRVSPCVSGAPMNAPTDLARLLPRLEGSVSPEEWQARVDLAAAYRLVALFRWDDLVFTHITAKIP